MRHKTPIGSVGALSASDGANFTNAGWQPFALTGSTVAASASYDPNSILSPSTLNTSASFQMMRLRTPTTGIFPNQAFVVHHDLRNMFGKGVVSGAASPQKMIEMMIQFPRNTALTIPSGTYAFMMLTDGHLSASTKGYGVQVRDDSGTGMRSYVVLNTSAVTYANVGATADAAGMKAAKLDIAFANNTQTKAISVTPLDNSGGQVGTSTAMAIDTTTRLIANGLTTLSCGFGWISGTVGATADVTASFKMYVHEPFALRGGSIDE